MISNRVQELTTSTGTGNIQLNGAVSTYRRFVDIVGVAVETYYVIEHLTANQFELGIGELSSASIFTRTSVIASSNSNALVDFSVGTKRIFVDVPKEYLVNLGTYTHNQEAASASWTITHNLGRFPSVSIVDSAGTLVVGDVQYVSSNVCSVTFSAAFSGKAYLN